MCSQEEIAQQRELLKIYRRNVALYLRQLAALGSAYTPPGVINGIYEARDNIKQIKDHLISRNVPVEDKPIDEQDESENLPIRIVPHQTPEIPDHYIERPEAQERLQQAILAQNGPALITLYGMSGTGKSTLAARVARCLTDRFVDGVLWGNLDNLSPADQFLSFLGSLDSTWQHTALSEKVILRDVFWQRISDRNTQLLIVFDNVKNTRQLMELLPPDSSIPHQCRIVAIGLNRFVKLPFRPYEQSVSYFNEEEAKTLFITRLGVEQHTLYSKQLQEISQKLEFVPQLLVAAAKEFEDRKSSPSMYVLKLRRGEEQISEVTNAIEEGLALTVRALSPEQLELFEAIGVFGDGDWTAAMLAAVTLRSPTTVRQILGVLSEYDLVKLVGTDRYHTNTLVRDFARSRFEQRPEYNRRAAYNLLARYCLDLAQNIDTSSAIDPVPRRVPGQAFDRIDPEFVRAFCAELLPDVSHFRRVMDWAINDKAWDVLLRFADIASLELHVQLIANSFEIQKSAMMATFVEPIVWQEGESIEFETQSYGHSANWRARSCLSDRRPVSPRVSGSQLLYSQPDAPSKTSKCELCLTILAGHIIDGLFDTMCLMNAQWVGVRANGLICKHISIIGGRFQACDISHSIWVNCDARYVTMHGSSLSHALLQDVKFQGADLQEIDLTGAVLENVDLRGADLRGANLTGAMLMDIDLRDADLRGANLTAAHADGVELNGCRIDDVCWADVRPHRFILEDPALLKEIELAAAQPVDASAKRVSRRWRPTAQLCRLTAPKGGKTKARHAVPTDPVVPDFSNADFRGVDLRSRFLTKYILRGADLRATQLQEAVLEGADLGEASLRAVDGKGANLSKSSLCGADLRAAILISAHLEQADLARAILRSTQLVEAHLQGAQLKGADLRRANLSHAYLNNAVLVSADLTDANIRHATLLHADLRDAHLESTDLADADFMGANLTDAICISTNFSNTTITEEQLAQAARLDRATLPEGQRVEVFDEVDLISISPEISLRFAHFDGVFEQLDLSGRDMRGAHLDGMFKRMKLAGADLAYSRLSGKFSRVDCSAANLASARLSGTFYEVDFRSADFEGASLRNASLVNVDLTGALNLSDDQLRQARRLRGALMPDGSRYDGRFNLTGDREDALKVAVNPDDPAAMERFLDGSRPKFVRAVSS